MKPDGRQKYHVSRSFRGENPSKRMFPQCLAMFSNIQQVYQVKGVSMMAMFENLLTGEVFEGHQTTEHPASSYGRPVWVRDDNGEAFDLVGIEMTEGEAS